MMLVPQKTTIAEILDTEDVEWICPDWNLIPLDVNMDGEPEVVVPYEKSGFIHTKEEWEKIKQQVDLFYSTFMTDEDVKQYNLDKLDSFKCKPKRQSQMEKPGEIYLALSSATGKYKIGLSKDSGRRIRELNNGSEDVRLLHVFFASDMRVAEEFLHSEFHSKRIKGEWFNLSQEDVAWIQSITEYKDGRFIVR